jgi:hypothetical protein
MTNVFEQLGIYLPEPAEMYTNTIKEGVREGIRDRVHFSKADANVWEATPPSSASQPSAPFEEIPKKSGKNQPLASRDRKLSTNDYYTEIRLSMGNLREGTRTSRISTYISIKSDVDRKYSIFLRSSLTSSLDETLRSIKKTDNKPLQTIAEDFIEEHKDCDIIMLGRIRYNPRKGLINEMHRKNLKHALLGLYSINGQLYATLFLLGEEYQFELSNELSPKQQQFYETTGLWEAEINEFTGDEELE